MNLTPTVLIFFLLSGIGCAWFAGQRHRNPAAWFLVGCLLGPIGVLLVLWLKPLPESKSQPAIGRAIVGAVLLVILMIAIVTAGAEVWERYQEGERYSELRNWEMYGDALIRFTKTTEHPADAIVVKSAVQQIDDYERQLQDGMRMTTDDLGLSMSGVRHSVGACAVLENSKRIVTFQSPEWPAAVAIDTSEQKVRVAALSQRISQYQTYLDQISAARTDTTATAAKN